MPSMPSDPDECIENWVLEAVHRALPCTERHVRPNPALDARLDQDLGLDSLSRVELITRLEKEFEVRFATRDLQQVSTVRDLAEMVCRLKRRNRYSSTP